MEERPQREQVKQQEKYREFNKQDEDTHWKQRRRAEGKDKQTPAVVCTLLLLHLCVNDEASEHPLVNKHYKQYHYGCDTPLPLLIYTPCRFTSNLDEILSTSIPGMTFTLTVSKLRASNQGYYCGHQSCQRKCLEELNTRVIYLIASDISDKCVPH